MTLTTARLRLRPLRLDDAAACNAYESDPEVVRFTTHGVRTLAESRAAIERSVAGWAAGKQEVWDYAIERAAEGDVIGRVGFGVRGEAGAALWYICRRDCWGQGYVSEAVRPVVDDGFVRVGLRRMWADIDPRNAASIRIVERLGMRREAHHIENVRIKGQWCSTLIYALLGREWQELRLGRD